MFRKFSRALSKTPRTTVRLDVNVVQVTGLPSDAASAVRVVWARDSKVQMTKIGKSQVESDEDGSVCVSWESDGGRTTTLSIIATLDPGVDGGFGKKEYDFKVQSKVVGKEGRFVTLGKCKVDLAQYVDSTLHHVKVPLSVGGGKKAMLSFTVLGVPVKGLVEEDHEEEEEEEEVSSIGGGSSRDLSSGGVHGEEEEGGVPVEQGTLMADDTEMNTISPHIADNNNNNDTNNNGDDDVAAKKVDFAPAAEEEEEEEEEVEEKFEHHEQEEEEEWVLRRLEEAENDAEEAKRMLGESIDMLEEETAARQQAEEAVESLERELEWLEKKSVKERADWESRMKDSLHKMESTVLLLEKVQKEKEEMEKRYEQSQTEVVRLGQLLDAEFVEEKIRSAEMSAKKHAEEQAAIEVDSLKRQIKTMASRLETVEARGATAVAAVSIAGAESGALKEAEEKVKSMSLEIQYLKIEIESLRQDASAATAAAERVEQASRREAEVYAQRAADYAEQLRESQEMCAEAERSAAEARSRIIILEDTIERGNLQTAELRQRLALVAMQSGGQVGEGTSNGSEMEDVMRLMREAQDSAESRAAQLASVTQELSSTQEELSRVMQQLLDTRQEADDAARLAMTMEEEASGLRQELKKRDETRRGYEQFQDDVQSILDSGGHATRTADAEATSHSNCSGGILPRFKDAQDLQAHELASEASQMAAELTEHLATSNQEKTELKSRLEEIQFELQKVKSENDGQLRKRVETLERELIVAQNRAEVNEIFRGEHDRVAQELITAKILVAETQEELIVLKRNLFKSQEKSMNFASKLTKLETKLYRKLSKVSLSSPRRRRTSSSQATEKSPRYSIGSDVPAAAVQSPSRDTSTVQ
jgi:hypothetical protein